MKPFLLFIILSLAYLQSHGQYAPQAGLTGSEAIYKDSNIIVDWGNECSIQRGWMDTANTSLGLVTHGDSSLAFGIADADVVSLGDGGIAIYYVANAIQDKAGPDFAIFENGFRNPLDSNEAYSELAFVEVSNDGNQYFRFPAYTNLDTNSQIAGTGEYIDARQIENLAGKYIGSWGTPFDLSDLNNPSGLDLNQIHYIKIIDVVGSIAENNCTRDANQHKINDPYPTPFPTGGFDLDALGIIHHQYPTSTFTVDNKMDISIYPNPTQDILFIQSQLSPISYSIYSMEGVLLSSHAFTANPIQTSNLPRGNYLLCVHCKNGKTITNFFTKL